MVIVGTAIILLVMYSGFVLALKDISDEKSPWFNIVLTCIATMLFLAIFIKRIVEYGTFM